MDDFVTKLSQSIIADEGQLPTVSEIIRNSMGHLTKAERKVARVLLATYPLAGLETVTQLANRAGVSAPTVIRLIAKLGFAGYPQFQSTLRNELQARLSSPLMLYQRRPSSEGAEEVLRSSREIFLHDIEATFYHVSIPEFQAVADLLADQRFRLLAMGGRFSQILAYYLIAHMHSLRPGSYLIGSGLAPRADELLDVSKRDVLVVFDYRRYQEDTIQAARIAASQGTTIVLFTDPWLSPIAEVARYVLTAPVDAPSPFDSLVGALALVEALVVAVTVRLGDRARRRIERLDAVRDMFLRQEDHDLLDGRS